MVLQVADICVPLIKEHISIRSSTHESCIRLRFVSHVMQRTELTQCKAPCESDSFFTIDSNEQ